MEIIYYGYLTQQGKKNRWWFTQDVPLDSTRAKPFDRKTVQMHRCMIDESSTHKCRFPTQMVQVKIINNKAIIVS